MAAGGGAGLSVHQTGQLIVLVVQAQEVEQLCPEAPSGQTVEEEVHGRVKHYPALGEGERGVDDGQVEPSGLLHIHALDDALRPDEEEEAEGHDQEQTSDLVLRLFGALGRGARLLPRVLLVGCSHRPDDHDVHAEDGGPWDQDQDHTMDPELIELSGWAMEKLGLCEGLNSFRGLQLHGVFRRLVNVVVVGDGVVATVVIAPRVHGGV